MDPPSAEHVRLLPGVLGLTWAHNKVKASGESIKYVVAYATHAGHDIVLAHDTPYGKCFTSTMLASLPDDLGDFHGYEVLPEGVPR